MEKKDGKTRTGDKFSFLGDDDSEVMGGDFSSIHGPFLYRKWILDKRSVVHMWTKSENGKIYKEMIYYLILYLTNFFSSLDKR